MYCWKHILRSPLRALVRDEQGGILIIFAVGFFTLLLAVGGAIEFGEAIIVKSKLGGAIDSAALAAATAPTASQNAAAQRYFEANYTTTAGTSVSYNSLAVSGIGGNQVSIKADANMNTNLLRVNGINSIPVSTKSVVQVKNNASLPDVDMVVIADNSKSMEDYNRFTDLQSALYNVVNILALQSPATVPNVRFGLSTYSTTLLNKYALNADKDNAMNAINAMVLNRYTCGACGLKGALEIFTNSPAPASARDDGANYGPNKIAIFMTDGMQNTGLDGIEHEDEDPWDILKPAHDETLAQCALLKANDVTVYTIGFSSDSQLPHNLATLSDCASTGTDGNPLTYYAPDGATLNSIFSMITTNVTKIRIVE